MRIPDSLRTFAVQVQTAAALVGMSVCMYNGDVKTTIYVPDDLAARIQAVKDELNVSEICQAALTQAVSAAEQARIGDRRQLIAQRLSRSRTPAETLREQGIVAGRQWAADAATLSDLKGVVNSRDDDMTLGSRLQGIKMWASRVASSSTTVSKPIGIGGAILASLVAVAATFSFDRPEFVTGFRDGAREVWKSVEPVLESRTIAKSG